MYVGSPGGRTGNRRKHFAADSQRRSRAQSGDRGTDAGVEGDPPQRLRLAVPHRLPHPTATRRGLEVLSRSRRRRGGLRGQRHPDPGPVARITSPAANVVASDRTPASDPWQEIAVLDGSTVAMVAVQGPSRLSNSETRRLITLLRG